MTVLVDPGVPAEQRSLLAQRAVGGQLGLQARTLLGVLAGGRWSEPEDLVAAIEEIGFRALAGTASADSLEAELFTVRRAVTSDGRLELALGNQASPVAARLGLVDSLLRTANPATTAIVRHVVQLPRGRKPAEALDRARRSWRTPPAAWSPSSRPHVAERRPGGCRRPPPGDRLRA